MLNAERSAAAVTVGEALGQRAAELRRAVAFARTRLDGAAALIAVVSEPGPLDGVAETAERLSVAESLVVDAETVLARARDDSDRSITALAAQVRERYGNAETDAEADRWEDEAVGQLTVAALADALGHRAGVTA